MKLITPVLAAIVLLTSCSASHRTHKTQTVEVKTDSSHITIDTTKITTHEKTTTTTTIPADTLNAEVNTGNDIDPGIDVHDPEEPVVKEDDNIKLVVKKDTAKKRVLITVIQKPKEAVTVTEKTTQEQAGKTDIQVNTKDTKKQTADSERQPKTNWTIIIIASIIVLAIFIFLYLKLPSFRKIT